MPGISSVSDHELLRILADQAKENLVKDGFAAHIIFTERVGGGELFLNLINTATPEKKVACYDAVRHLVRRLRCHRYFVIMDAYVYPMGRRELKREALGVYVVRENGTFDRLSFMYGRDARGKVTSFEEGVLEVNQPNTHLGHDHCLFSNDW